MKFKTMVIGVSAALVFAGCGSTTKAPTETATPGTPVASATPETTPEVTVDDGAAQLVKIEGDKVYLAGNPTTGYEWSSFFLSEGAEELVSVSDYEYEAESDLMGANGVFTFTITGLKAGEADIGFVYSRNFEEDSVAATQLLHVTVADDLSVTIEVNDNPANVTVETKDGATVVSMISNPTTGYDWTGYYLEGSDAIVTIGEQTFEASTDVTGASGTASYTLTGVKEGTGVIGFSYSQAQTADTMIYDVLINVTVGSDLSVTATLQ